MDIDFINCTGDACDPEHDQFINCGEDNCNLLPIDNCDPIYIADEVYSTNQ